MENPLLKVNQKPHALNLTPAASAMDPAASEEQAGGRIFPARRMGGRGT
jgi:hypothetical protein